MSNLPTNRVDGTAMATNHAGDHNNVNTVVNSHDTILQYNVKANGAIGDGVADDTTAIQTTITAASSGGTVYFPAGTYKVTAALTVSVSGVSLVGTGKDASIITGSLTDTGTALVLIQSNPSNILIENLGFQQDGGTSGGVQSKGHIGLTIRGCKFTGATTTASGALILLDGNVASNAFADTVIEKNSFVDATGAQSGVIRLYPRSGHTIDNTRILNNYFRNVHAPCISLDAYDFLRNTLIDGNQFLDITYDNTAGHYKTAISGGLAMPAVIYNTVITNNQYRNTLGGTSHGFVHFYSWENTIIRGNTAFSNANNGPAFAPGRTTNPVKFAVISNNYVEGFDSFWDPDSMQYVEVCNNIIKNCNPGAGFGTGYGTQEHVDIHDNLVVNCWNSDPNVAGLISNSNNNTVASKIHDNIIVEDNAVQKATKLIVFTGGAFLFTDLEIYNNKFHMVQNNISSANFINRQGTATASRRIEGNILKQPDGVYTDINLFDQGNITSAMTFDRGSSAIIKATLTGNISPSLTSGVVRGETLELRLTQDGTGGRTVTWPANFKKAGGTLNLTATANATDVIQMRWDGTNWIEAGRQLNTS